MMEGGGMIAPRLWTVTTGGCLCGCGCELILPMRDIMLRAYDWERDGE